MLWKTYFHQTCFSIKNVDINHGILFSLILVFGWTFEMKALWFSTLYIEAVKLFFIVNKSFISKRLNHKRTSCFWNYGKRGDYKFKSFKSNLREQSTKLTITFLCNWLVRMCMNYNKKNSIVIANSIGVEVRYHTIIVLLYNRGLMSLVTDAPCYSHRLDKLKYNVSLLTRHDGMRICPKQDNIPCYIWVYVEQMILTRIN